MTTNPRPLRLGFQPPRWTPASPLGPPASPPGNAASPLGLQLLRWDNDNRPQAPPPGLQLLRWDNDNRPQASPPGPPDPSDRGKSAEFIFINAAAPAGLHSEASLDDDPVLLEAEEDAACVGPPRGQHERQ